MKKADLAYIAGLIDGEGCISLTKKFRKGKSPEYRIILRVGNTDPLMVGFCRKRLGGFIYLSHSKKRKHKCYVWKTAGGNAIIALKKVYPFLITKRKKAKLAFEFRKTFCKNPICGSGHTVSKGILKRRESAYIKMKKLTNSHKELYET